MPSPSVETCLNILRRTPVEETEQNTTALATLLTNEEDVEELFQRVDYPLKHASDPNAGGKKYLLCDHNRDGESHRSPWSNEYNPPLVSPSASSDDHDTIESFRPSQNLRKLEIVANEVFESYCALYYGTEEEAISSVYLWDKGEGGNGSSNTSNKSGFAGCFLISKIDDSRIDEGRKGFWNSIHVVDVGQSIGGKVRYKLTSTVLLSMDICATTTTEEGTKNGKDTSNINASSTNVNVSGSQTEQMERTCAMTAKNGEAISTDHILNIGKMIEEIEAEIRSKMDSLYIPKTKEVVDSIHCSSVENGRLGLMARMAMMNGHVGAMQVDKAAILGARAKLGGSS